MQAPILSREASYGSVAAEQYGLITSRQLIDLGLSRSAISRRIKSGVLIGVLPGVWRLAGVPRSWHQRVLGVHLWAGEASSIAGLAAAALHKLDGFAPCSTIEVVTRRSLKSPNRLVVVRRPRALPADDRTVVARIPVTTCERTLVDIAGTVTAAQLELPFEDARRRRLVSVEQMRDRMRQLPANKSGRRNLVRLVQLTQGTRPSESALEVKFLRLLRSQGYPAPIRQQALDDRGVFVGRVDLAYPDRRLIIEVDGYEHHDSGHKFHHDRERRNRLVGMDWAVINATSKMLRGRERECFLTDLRRLYDRPLA